MTIIGSGFEPGAAVTIGGVAAKDVTVADATHITAAVPALPPGWQTIVVSNAGGSQGEATNALRVYSPYDPDGCGGAPRHRAEQH